MSTFSVEQAAPPSPPSQSLHPIPSAWHPDSRESIRGDSGGFEALDLQARLLAGACRTAARTATEGPLLQQLSRNGRLLVEAYRKIAEAAGQNLTLTPDAEWLLDNFYIVEEVLREVRHDLPRGYYQKLPKLAGTPLAGYPRVYALALALIAHTDSNLDEARITRFVQAFQTVAPLTIGELWAVPTMLRLGLIENLCRMSEAMLRVWAERRARKRGSNRSCTRRELKRRPWVPSPNNRAMPSSSAPSRCCARKAGQPRSNRPRSTWPAAAWTSTTWCAARTSARPSTRSRSATA